MRLTSINHHFKAVISLVAITYCLTFNFVSTAFAGDSNRENIVRQTLMSAGVNFVELKGVGFGIRKEGQSRINKLAQRLHSQFDTVFVLDLREQVYDGLFEPKINGIFIKINEANIADLISLKPSHVKTVLLHEIRHAYMRKKFDNQSKITVFSANLAGKKPNALTQIFNPYYQFLSFEEFSTFSKQLRQYLQVPGIVHQSKFVNHINILDSFNEETVKALQFFERNLNTHEVRLSARHDIGTKGSFRSLLLESAEWNLSLLVDFDADQVSKDELIKYIHERLSKTLSFTSQIKQRTEKLIELSKQPTFNEAEIRSQIDQLNSFVNKDLRLQPNSFTNKNLKPRSIIRCEGLF